MSSERKRKREARPPASAAEAAERLARIVDAAERAAESVIDDAERQAQRHIEEARERADRLVAERLRELADELEAGGRPTPAEPGDSNPDGERGAPHLRPLAGGPDEPRAPRDVSAGARLLATQMAVSGASRAEIAQRLRAGFELDDTDEVLDAILGPEG